MSTKVCRRKKRAPQCGYMIPRRRNPLPTVDIIIEYQGLGLVLIDRANPPYGWALPGGFVDYGESLEAAAIREAREETGLTVSLLGQFHTYSDPRRDPRQHTITTVYVAQGFGTPRAADDARSLAIFAPEQLPAILAFDHGLIMAEYLKVRRQWLYEIKKVY